MENYRSSKALLMEILIATLLFALCASVVLGAFSATRTLTDRAGNIDRAMRAGRDLADRVWAGETVEDVTTDAYTLTVTTDETESIAGTLRTAAVTVTVDDETVAVLPCSRFLPKGGIAP